MRTDINAAVHRFVVDTFLYRESPDLLRGDDSLLALGLVDSTGVLDLVQFLEAEFSINIADDEIVPENLDSVNRIVDFVRRKLAASEPVQRAAHAG